MTYKKTLNISLEEYDKIEQFLSGKNIGEDDTITYTVHFPNCVEADIKCCGVQEDTPYTEAVLFNHGSEVVCTEPSEGFLGEWYLEYDDDTYVVNTELMLDKLLISRYIEKDRRVNHAIWDLSKIIASRDGTLDKQMEIANQIHLYID